MTPYFLLIMNTNGLVTFPFSFNLSCYVDNTLLMFDKKGHVKKLLKYMNTLHRSIKVTFEEKQEFFLIFR